MDYFGLVELIRVENIYESCSPEFIPLQINQIKVIHYPDCQQLLIWLSHPGSEYGIIRWMDEYQKIIESYPTADKLNGSIQLCWDTLPFPPVKYQIEIDWKYGCKHVIFINKIESLENSHGKISELKNDPKFDTDKTPGDLTTDHSPIVYRDGFGNEIPNEDLILRENLLADLTNKFSRRLEFRGNFRSGYITYFEGAKKCDFIHEMGGGGCAFYIEIPSEEKWEIETGFRAKKRNEIIQFIAESLRLKENSFYRYEINDRSINFYQS